MVKLDVKMLGVICVLFFSPWTMSADIKINRVEGQKEQLIFSILQLALAKQESSLTLNQIDEVLPEERAVSDVAEGSLDVVWAGASRDLDDRLLPVRIPLLKGLLGHRIFLIRREDQPKFDRVQSLDDLKKFKAGMGAFWGSTRVLESTGLPVVKAVKYPSLFYMLDGERFDYFPRAVHEPWAEIANWPNLNLKVEEKLLLIYPYAMYFYVKKDNRELHKQLQRGLELAIADGSFDRLFYSNQLIKDALSRSNIRGRKVFRIANPEMHPDTPLNRPEFWLNLNNP